MCDVVNSSSDFDSVRGDRWRTARRPVVHRLPIGAGACPDNLYNNAGFRENGFARVGSWIQTQARDRVWRRNVADSAGRPSSIPYFG